MDIVKILREIREEERRTNQMLHLTANETLMSDTARSFMNLRLSDRYFMGGGDDKGIIDFGPFTFRGFPSIHDLITMAERAAEDMLDASSVNLKCLSGVHAMMCAILSTTDPGDAIMTVDMKHGGHFATKHIIERVGRKHLSTSYDFDSLSFDADAMGEQFHAAQAKALYMDVSFYINPHNLRQVREALGNSAIIIYDASHTLGLILGGTFQRPFLEGADVICGNTHKTLPGPQKGLVAFKDQELAEKANTIINSGLYSSSHTASMIALAITILEMKEFGQSYSSQVLANSNALAHELDKLGYDVRKANTGRYTENHQVHLMADSLGDYRELYLQLIHSRISVNFDNTLGGRMYIRLGTQDITRRGMTEKDQVTVAACLSRALRGGSAEAAVAELMEDHQSVKYSFDKILRQELTSSATEMNGF